MNNRPEKAYLTIIGLSLGVALGACNQPPGMVAGKGKPTDLVCHGLDYVADGFSTPGCQKSFNAIFQFIINDYRAWTDSFNSLSLWHPGGTSEFTVFDRRVILITSYTRVNIPVKDYYAYVAFNQFNLNAPLYLEYKSISFPHTTCSNPFKGYNISWPVRAGPARA